MRPSDHISDDFKSFGGREMIADVSEISKHNIKYYMSAGYSEAEARQDFIDNFFIALGWDVNHQT